MGNERQTVTLGTVAAVVIAFSAFAGVIFTAANWTASSVNESVGQLREEVGRVETSLRGEIQSLRAEMTAEHGELRAMLFGLVETTSKHEVEIENLQSDLEDLEQ